MDVLRAFIVDDEETEIAILSEHIRRYCAEHNLNAEIQTCSSGRSLIVSYEPPCDAVFLDIEMQNMDGMKAAELLRKMDDRVAVVFVTNMAQYAIRGYEVEALGFLIKPVNYHSLSIILDKIVRRRQDYTADEILIPYDGGIRRVSRRDIVCIEVMNHALIYHLIDGQMMTNAGSLSDLETQLEKYFFFRCHKSFLINLRYVTEIRTQSVIVKGMEIPVGRSRRKTLFEEFCKYLGVRQ